MFKRRKEVEPTKEEIALREALHGAIRENDLTKVQDLIERQGASVEAVYEAGQTALHLASWKCDLVMVQYLVESAKANVQAKTKEGDSVLQYASCGGHLLVVRYFVETHKVDVTEHAGGAASIYLPVIGGRLKDRPVTALQHAVIGGHFAVVQYFVETRSRCASVREIQLALCVASGSMKVYLEESLKLVQSHPEPMYTWTNMANGSTGCTELRDAIKEKDLAKVQDLVERQGAFVEAIDNYGWTALHTACQYGSLAIVEYLGIWCKANVEAIDDRGDTAFLWACHESNLSMVQCLVESLHVNVHAKTKGVDAAGYPGTALHKACANGNDEDASILIYLVEKCGLNNVEEKTPVDGCTALHCACSNGTLAMVRYLVEACGADVTKRSSLSVLGLGILSRATAFHRAVHFSRMDIVRYLVETSGCISIRELKEALNHRRFNPKETKAYLNERIALAKSNSTGKTPSPANDNVDPSSSTTSATLSNLDSANMASGTGGNVAQIKTSQEENLPDANLPSAGSGVFTPSGRDTAKDGLMGAAKIMATTATTDVNATTHPQAMGATVTAATDTPTDGSKDSEKHDNDDGDNNNGTPQDPSEPNSPKIESMGDTAITLDPPTFTEMTTLLQEQNQRLEDFWVQYNDQIQSHKVGGGGDDDPSTLSSITAAPQFTPEQHDVLVLMIGETCLSREEEEEKQAILANRDHAEFYLLLARKLYCMIHAFEVLSSSMVAHESGGSMRSFTTQLLQEKGVEAIKGTKMGVFLSDIVGWVKKNAACVPFLNTAGSICQLFLTLKDERDRYLGVAHVADFATLVSVTQSIGDGLRVTVERFARLMVRARIGHSGKPFVESRTEFGRCKQWLLHMLAESGKTPMKEQACKAADCCFAHIMDPSVGSNLHDLFHNRALDRTTSFHEALAAATLDTSVEEIRKLSVVHKTRVPIATMVVRATVKPAVTVATVVQPTTETTPALLADSQKAESNDAKVERLSREVSFLKKQVKSAKPSDSLDAGGGLVYADPREKYEDTVVDLTRQVADQKEQITVATEELLRSREEQQTLRAEQEAMRQKMEQMEKAFQSKETGRRFKR